jgi:hypothetical protein
LNIPLLVDEFEGPVHRTYGAGPNMACIIHRDGRLVYRSQWTDVDDLYKEIDYFRQSEQLINKGSDSKTSHFGSRTSHIEKIHIWVEDDATYEVRKRTYAKAGESAIKEFIEKKGLSPI